MKNLQQHEADIDTASRSDEIDSEASQCLESSMTRRYGLIMVIASETKARSRNELTASVYHWCIELVQL